MKHLTSLALLTIATFHPSSSLARVWTVEANGSGDAPTIQAAVDSSTSGDIIELEDGTFTGDGNRDVDTRYLELTFRSRSNVAENCVIDCQGSLTDNHRAFLLHRTCEFKGLTIINGFAFPRGGAIVSYKQEGGLRVYGCTFVNNTSSEGGAIGFQGVFRSIEEVDIQKSEFLRNHGEYGGAVYIAFFYASFKECQFIDNTSDWSAGAVSFIRSGVQFKSCVFAGNKAAVGGALYCYGDGAIMSCTFVGNLATVHVGGAHIRSFGYETVVTVRNSILAFGQRGGSVACGDQEDYNIEPVCCDVFGNEGGNWVDCLRFHQGKYGNISEDPLFCDWTGGDYSLSAESPCAAGSADNDCGLMGAFDVGCGPTAVETKSWGVIKAFYR